MYSTAVYLTDPQGNPLIGSNGQPVTVAGPLGRQADASSVSTALSTEDVALLNSLIAKLNGGLPAALGQTTKANSLAVVLASDQIPNAALLADGAALPTTPIFGAGGMLYNGATLDIQRGNIDATALASAARTATTSSADITNYNARGIVIFLEVTVASGTGGLTPRVSAKNPVTGTYFPIFVASAAQTTASNFCYTVYPGASGGSGSNFTNIVAAALPRTFKIQITHGDASSYTYSVGYSLIN